MAGPLEILKRGISGSLAGVHRRLFRDTAKNAQTTVLLSSGRSGSTWISTTLQQIPTTRVIFEPFHAGKGTTELSGHRFTYLDAQTSNDRLADSFRRVVQADIRKPWIEQFNTGTTLTYDRRLIKLVRANLLFPWLHKWFPEFRYILLLRHPAAVILSQLNGGWNLSSARLNAQSVLRDSARLERFDDYGWPEEGFASNLLFWIIENEIALECAKTNQSLVLHYENLCMNPDDELRRIEHYLNTKLPKEAWQQLDDASWSSHTSIGTLSAEEKVTNWISQITDEQMTILADLLKRSPLGGLYGTDPMPQ